MVFFLRDHAQRAIDAMKILLPPGNLMLSSANRVKALILEEQALDNFMNNAEDNSALKFSNSKLARFRGTKFS